MPHVRDSNSEAAARENFAIWLEGVLAIQRAKGRSKSAVAELTGINRNTIDRWLKKEIFPGHENVRKFCDALGLDYSEPSRLLGWSSDAKLLPRGDLSDFIRRAKQLADHPKTSERRRRQLEQQIAAAESVRQAAAAQRLTADQMERSAEALLREAMEDPEDANDR
jgi:transcriptional regulator with XRE-family HTH domain